MPRSRYLMVPALAFCLTLAPGCKAGVPSLAPARTAAKKPDTSTTATSIPPGTTASPDPLHAYFGRVVDPAGKPVAGALIQSYVVANNSGSLVTDNGSGLITDNGSGIVSNDGSTLVANNAGNVVASHGGSYRLMAAEPVTTDANGEFSVGVPQGETFNIEASKGDQLKAFMPNITSKSTGLDFKLAPPGTISGKVSFPEDAKVTNFLGVDVFIPGSSYDAKTAADGTFTLSGVPQGTYTLYATRHGLGGGHQDGVAVKSSANTDAGTLALKLLPLKIDSVAPALGTVGSTVTIKGGTFGTDQGLDLQVRLGGKVLEDAKATANDTLTFTVPDGYGSGDLVVDVEGHTSNAVHFDVVDKFAMTAPAASIEVGKTLTLGLSATTGASAGKKAIDHPRATWAITSGGSSATIDANGTLTATAPGAVTVTAQIGNLIAKGTLKVVAAGSLVSQQSGRPEPLLHSLADVAFAPDGKTAYLANDNDILKYDMAADKVTLLAGATAESSSGGSDDVDGSGDQARFDGIMAIALAQDGSLYVAEASHIRQVDPNGNVTTVAGNNGQTSSNATDQDALQASLNQISNMVLDGSNVWFLDVNDIRELTGGRVKTIKPNLSVNSGGPLWRDARGTLWTADANEIVPDSGAPITIMGSTGPVMSRLLSLPAGDAGASGAAAPGGMMAVNTAGFGALPGGSTATDIGSGDPTVIPGDGTTDSQDGIVQVMGLVQDGSGNFVMSGDGYLLSVTPAGVRTIIAGGATGQSVDGLGLHARFTGAGNLRFAPDGTLYMAEAGGLRKIALAPGGANVTTVLQSAAGVQKFQATKLTE